MDFILVLIVLRIFSFSNMKGMFVLLFLPKTIRFIFILKTNRKYYQ